MRLEVDVDDVKVLRDIGDRLREKLGSGVLVLAVVGGPEVKLLAMVTKDLVDKIHAGTLLGEIATQLGGKAGGRADLALGGGRSARGARLRMQVDRRSRVTNLCVGCELSHPTVCV